MRVSIILPLASDERRIRYVEDVRELFGELGHGRLERCGFAYLDPEWRLLGTRLTDPGDVDHVTVPIRAVIGDVVAFGARAMVMVHNHTNGDPRPSEIDLAMTRRLATALDAIDARLVDHVVLAGDRYASMRDMGLL